jgi:hypothetical protein
LACLKLSINSANIAVSMMWRRSVAIKNDYCTPASEHGFGCPAAIEALRECGENGHQVTRGRLRYRRAYAHIAFSFSSISGG